MVGALGLLLALPGGDVDASDHNEPSPDPVWPAASALHQEWDLSDLFAWYDEDTDSLNLIVAWHPQQLPLSDGEGAEFSDEVLFEIHLRDQDWFLPDTRVIDFRYGVDEEGHWGMLVRGLPGLERVVIDCDTRDGAVAAHFDEAQQRVTLPGRAVMSIATGVWDDPFVFDVEGFNASLARALNGEVGLAFDPRNDTFEGFNVTAFVVSIPMSEMDQGWRDLDVDDGLNIWATTRSVAAGDDE